MSLLAALLLMQNMQIPAPVLAETRPATGWRCGFTVSDGSSFWLAGTMPEASAGWDPNTGMPIEVEGNGPAPFVGTHQVKPFSSGEEYRRYYMTVKHSEGGHYNLIFILLRGTIGAVTVERFAPNPETGRGGMSAYATGSCKSDFDESTGEAE